MVAARYLASTVILLDDKIPDCLADFCKCLSINQMASGSRLSFSFLHLFQTGLSRNMFEQAVGHSVLQTFRLKIQNF